MTRVQKLAERRREVNARLAQIDASNRCAMCRRNLAEAKTPIEVFGDPRRYCSTECASARSKDAAS